MASTFVILPTPLLYKPNTASLSNSQKLLPGLRRNSMRVNAIAQKWEPAKVVPQANRVLIRLDELPQKSIGGVLLPKTAVKFECYLMGEAGKKSPPIQSATAPAEDNSDPTRPDPQCPASACRWPAGWGRRGLA
ncbi:hypothetical protein TB2_012824 [Malus domestica]